MIKQISRSEQLSRLILRGYKSVEECDLELGRLNVLIGANGVGKSNFIGFFRLVNRILDQQLQTSVGLAGGPDAMLHFGRKRTEALHAELYFGHYGYRFTLQPTQDNRMMFACEALWSMMHGEGLPGTGHFETHYKDRGKHGDIWQFVVPAMRSWRLFHFHDTSASALVKQIHSINDNEYLRDDARNLAAFLLRLKNHHDEHYRRIIKAVRLIAPFFDDFHLCATVGNQEKIQLEWTELGQDQPFPAGALSDGTLRFICLAAVLLQPEEFMPATILIDEPELGLHPFAINELAGLMKSAARRRQLIISTQSVELGYEFDAADLIVVDKCHGASTFFRPDSGTMGRIHLPA
ncbi:MAG: AAA family ATPase [Paludibacterium sp.]|uniref:AAA family ATPase n=1 Tax=Paludibacterium sp. TaxID=1917523 RepID=UPI0025FD0B65|nr:AAA family ATPase [Paludibacterium sp.]MBV8046619.1 AAA family ATPase [Paludibacterium sp.]MBV8646446.1 AAA family ATPase [Paludibacterium sp.]